MSTKPLARSKRKPRAKPSILLRYRDLDTVTGVSRNTATRLAETLGLSETQVIHFALAQLARQTLPRYGVDSGPLTEAQLALIDKLVPQSQFVVRKSLF